MNFKLLVMCSLALAAHQASACYTVYDASNRIVYNAQIPPVDMSYPIHQTLPLLYPNSHLVFNRGGECPNVQSRGAVTIAASPTPLLTDAQTAASLKLPHVILPSGVALVPRRPASMRPGVSTLGAIPVAAAPVPAGPVRAGTVITEMRNPPMTVVQNGANLAVSDVR